MNKSLRPSKASFPRFRGIVEILRKQIGSGDLPAHAALPSERVIAQTHNVSRMTARRALETIEAEGLAYSADRRGRFVSPARLRYDISQMVSFTADAAANGADLSIEVIRTETITADAALSNLLEVEEGQGIHAYTRLFRMGGHAIFIETEFVIAALCPDFLDRNLEQSTTKLLEDEYDICASTGDIVIRMRGVTADEAALLGLAANHGAIELEQVIRDANHTPFCLGRQIWRGELAEFSARALVNQEEGK